MKGSLIVVGFFALGCLLGWSGWLPDVVIENDITVYVLYLLMFQVGLSIGSDKKLKDILGSIRPKLLLVPLATIAGTLVFSALVGLLLTQWSVFYCLAVGSGFAYYSLSSATPFFKKQTIDSPASQYTPYRTSQGKQECLTTQRGKIIDNILIRADRYSQKEKKQKDRIRNRFADLLQKFDFAQKIACGNTREHNTNDSKHR